MSIAALYDIHGNLPALEAILAECEAEGVERIVVGGDVLPGPMPGECLERLREVDVPTAFISGNGEREVLGVRAGVDPWGLPAPVVEVLRWTAGVLETGDVEWIRGWPATATMEIEGVGAVLFCHATPGSDSEIFTRATPEDAVASRFHGVEAEVVVCGHTHMQFDRRIAHLRVVNAGSVGMPFGEPGAYWLRLGPDIELRRTPYDLEAAAARVRATAYPGADDFATSGILGPRAEASVVEAFERAAGRGEDAAPRRSAPARGPLPSSLRDSPEREERHMSDDTATTTSHTERTQPETFRGRALMASLTVDDLQESLAWYRDVIGFMVDEEHERDGKVLAVSLMAGTVRILLNQDDGAKGWDREKGVGCSLHVVTAQDVDELAARIQERGGTLDTPPTDMPWGARVFRVVDPDGFKMSISSEP